MRYLIIEILVSSTTDLEEARKIVAEKIRDGDGLHLEQSRLFLVLAEAGMAEAVAVAARMNGNLEELGAEAVVRPMGTDALTDSLYRRVEALVLPAAPRIR